MAVRRLMAEPELFVTLVDLATGEPPRLLGEGDALVILGTPKKQRNGEIRQSVETRRARPVEEAEVAVYDAIESLRGRVEVSSLGDGPGRGSRRLRAQRLRQAARVLDACVKDLALAVEKRL
jgi:hypothetical protein